MKKLMLVFCAIMSVAYLSADVISRYSFFLDSFITSQSSPQDIVNILSNIDESGYPLLYKIAKEDDIVSFKMILDRLQALNLKATDMIAMINAVSNDMYDTTVLHFCARKGKTEFCKVIMDVILGLDMSYEEKIEAAHPKNSLYTTPSHYAAMKGHVKIVDSIMRKLSTLNRIKAQEIISVINVRDIDEATPLLKATKSGHTNVVKKILEIAKSSLQNHDDFLKIVNAQDAEQRTALYRSAEDGNEEIAAFLVSSGADTSITDSRGLTASDVAKEHGYDALASRLAPGARQKSARTFIDHSMLGKRKDLKNRQNPEPKKVKYDF